jgi:hypothetical protein
MSDSSGAIKYEQLPSNAVEYLELDYDNSLVKIIFKSNMMKQYCYKCEDLEDFQSKFMELSGRLEDQQDRDDEDNLVESEEDTVQREDASIGRFINDRIRAGYLKIDTVLTQHPDMLDVGWEPFNGSTIPEGGVVLEDSSESVTEEQAKGMIDAIMKESNTQDT